MSRVKNLIGQRFTRLVVQSLHKTHNGRAIWNCRCDCGNDSIVWSQALKAGRVRSCGCLKVELQTKHGFYRHPLYGTWKSMIDRCVNKNCKDFPNYGGRGIRVCRRWSNNPGAFIEDMGARPAGTSLDRIDVNGNYEPGNCRWATNEVQGKNRRNSIYLVVDGSKLHVNKCSEIFGLPSYLIRERLYAGWSHEDAAKTKPDLGNRWKRISGTETKLPSLNTGSGCPQG